MSIKIIENRLKEYAPKTKAEEFNALKEIVQEIALCGLTRAHFFKVAAFQGGSCLRIVYNINRFSEDLDFILLQPNKTFIWEPFFNALHLECKAYGLNVQLLDKSKADPVIKKAFLKDDSFGKVLLLSHARDRCDEQIIKIKLEIDTNPPAGSTFKTNFLTFPYPFSIVTQDLPSLFASKCHALLCRDYIKGRDWFDFIWYVTKKTDINLMHLQAALHQNGPWKDQPIVITNEWLIKALKDKITSIDWDQAKQDIGPFLNAQENQGLTVWGIDFFMSLLTELSITLKKP